MPVATVEQIKQREVSIRKKIAALGESGDGAGTRKLGKKLRRAQRRRRRMVVEQTRRAAQSKKPAEAPAETGAKEA